MRWLGSAKRAQDIAADHARRRKAFGKQLGEHEGVSFMLADNAMDIHAARLAIQHCAWVLDCGGRGGTESSMTKVIASEAIMRVADRALQILGGVGRRIGRCCRAVVVIQRRRHLFERKVVVAGTDRHQRGSKAAAAMWLEGKVTGSCKLQRLVERILRASPPLVGIVDRQVGLPDQRAQPLKRRQILHFYGRYPARLDRASFSPDFGQGSLATRCSSSRSWPMVTLSLVASRLATCSGKGAERSARNNASSLSA